jgi:hypothetical protein
MPGRVDARYTSEGIIRVSKPTLGREGHNSTNRSAPATAVCPVCSKRFERGRHRNQFHRAGARVIESSRYCSPKCRQSAWRTCRDIRNEIPHQLSPIAPPITSARDDSLYRPRRISETAQFSVLLHSLNYMRSVALYEEVRVSALGERAIACAS